jgi:hypothetical protein
VFAKTLNQGLATLQLGSLGAGVYLYKIKNTENQNIENGKLMIQH